MSDSETKKSYSKKHHTSKHSKSKHESESESEFESESDDKCDQECKADRGEEGYTSGNNNDNNASQEIIIPSFNTTDYSITGDLFLYGTIPFRYISVIAGVNNVVLHNLTFNLCDC